MPLFHATTQNLEIGETLTEASESTFYPKTISVFEQNRPNNLPRRCTSFFAAESPEFCTYFLTKQGVPFDRIFVYQVEICTPHKAPFALTHAINRLIEARKDPTSLACEYWSPQRNWKFYEHFGATMKIVAQVETPQVCEITLRVWYDGDFDQACGMS